MANGSMSSSQLGEAEIRAEIVKQDLVDCIVSLPAQLLYSTQIPICIWVIAKDKADSSFRKRSGETLFINARNLGSQVERVRRQLDKRDILQIAHAYHTWRNADTAAAAYKDIPGFCKSVHVRDIERLDCVLTPTRYVGEQDAVSEREPFDLRMKRLTTILDEYSTKAASLDQAIWVALKELGYER